MGRWHGLTVGWFSQTQHHPLPSSPPLSLFLSPLTARFELLFARFLVICGPRPNPIDYVSAYIAVLREITRLEMDEVTRGHNPST